MTTRDEQGEVPPLETESSRLMKTSSNPEVAPLVSLPNQLVEAQLVEEAKKAKIEREEKVFRGGALGVAAVSCTLFAILSATRASGLQELWIACCLAPLGTIMRYELSLFNKTPLLINYFPVDVCCQHHGIDYRLPVEYDRRHGYEC